MTSSKSSQEDLLGESWVDIANDNMDAANANRQSPTALTESSNPGTRTGTTTPMSVNLNAQHIEDYLHLLVEAQRESPHSSAKVSIAGSRKDSARSSPKSPPNSPVQGSPMVLDWHSYYVNSEAKEEGPLDASKLVPCDSKHSSSKVSIAGSRKDSARSSPKSPPNSPLQGSQGSPVVLDWHSYYANSEAKEEGPLEASKLLPWDSRHSSSKVSMAGSRKDSARSSPKSPQNSPLQGSQDSPVILDWHSYYANSEAKEEPETYFDWSSRPEQVPPKTWNFRAPKRDLLSIRCAKVGDTNIFSRKGLCALFLTNLISLILGTGVGLWLSRHGFFVPAVKVR